MNTKKTSRDIIFRAAIILLLVVLTSTTMWAETKPVTYIMADGTTKGTVTATVLTGSSSRLSSGWYVVDNNIDGTLDFNGDVNIIILDNKSVTITGSDGITVNGNLTIYGQSQGTGSLIIEALSGDNCDGIYTKNGNITINGGIINISAHRYGIYCKGNITINSGRIIANDTEGINATGNITLGSNKYTDYIFAKNYSVSDGKTISIANGQTLIDGENYYSGTITNTNSINEKYLALDLFGISEGHNGSEGNPCIISSPEGLQLLATYVNSGTICTSEYGVYYNRHFKLGGDIKFDSSIDNNFTPIGDDSHIFQGTFDGDGHTISGIRINNNVDMRVGTFGHIGQSATVKNLTLVNASITGDSHNTGYIGGIVGHNNSGKITNCLVTNSTINGNGYTGSIVGYNQEGTLSYNYYGNCTVNNKNSQVGCGTSSSSSADVSTNDGAVKATVLSEDESVPVNLSGKVVFSREFTDGSPSTICLPFAYTPEASIGTFYTFTSVEKVGNNWVATMTEANKVNGALTANTPYLFKAASTGTVMFHGPAAASISAGTTTSAPWTFKGTYNEIKWNEDNPPVGIYGFSAQAVADDGIYQGQFVKVGKYVKIRSLRAYLQYGSNTTRGSLSEEELPDRILVRLVGSGETSIGQLDLNTGEVTFDDGWYTLDGIRLNGKPTKQGIYVNKGKKYIIK